MTTFVKFKPGPYGTGDRKDIYFIPADEPIKGVPDVRLTPSAYYNMSEKTPDPSAPTIGVVMGVEGGQDDKPLIYRVRHDILWCLTHLGVKIKFITPTPENAEKQLKSCQALLLPDEDFELPEEYYYLPPKEAVQLSPLCQTYQKLIKQATALGLPILGLGTGAQMVGAHYGMKVTPVNQKLHNVPYSSAHNVRLVDPEFIEILHEPGYDERSNLLLTRSCHKMGMAMPKSGDMEVFAQSTADDVPEAWGNFAKGILCIQWRVDEDSTDCLGRDAGFYIFEWLRYKAADHKPVERKDLV